MKLLFLAFLLTGFSAQATITNSLASQGRLISGVPVVIANGGTASAAISLAGMSLVGIQFPAAFTGTTVTFTASDAVAGTYVVVKTGTGGSSLSYTVAQGTFAAIDPKDFQGMSFLKIVSGSAEGGARTLLVSLKGI